MSITIEPQSCLFDEVVDIVVKNLVPKQPVTLQSMSITESCDVFQCFVHYNANEKGEVRVKTQPAIGGMYKGVEPMGLFWAMEESEMHNHRFHVGFSKKNVCTPCVITIKVYIGHLNGEEAINNAKPIAKVANERWYKCKEVERIPVKHKRLKGTMFIPVGPGPFPAILDIRGYAIACSEHRAALLASKDFITLAVTHFRHPNLSEKLRMLEIEYFEEAVQYLLSHPKVLKKGVGVLGSSYGGMVAQALVAYVPKVRCAVSINGSHYGVSVPIKYQDRVRKRNMKSRTYFEDYVILSKDLPDVLQKDEDGEDSRTIDIHKAEGAMMLIVGEDDGIIDSLQITKKAQTLMESNGKQNFTVLRYAGAGHHIEPPFCPFHPIIQHPDDGVCHFYGGSKIETARANEHSWKQCIMFFRIHLQNSASVMELTNSFVV